MLNTPKSGDVVVCTNGPEIGKFAVLEGKLCEYYGKQMICYSATVFRDDNVVVCSGGPAYFVSRDELVKTDRMFKREFWRWKNGVPGRGREEKYYLDVALWEYARKESHCATKRLSVDEIFERRNSVIPEDVKSFPNPGHTERGKRYVLFRGEQKICNFQNNVGLMDGNVDVYGLRILECYKEFEDIYIERHPVPVGSGYLYTASGGMKAGFKDKRELDVFLGAYSLGLFDLKGLNVSLIIFDGDTSKWKRIKWREIV